MKTVLESSINQPISDTAGREGGAGGEQTYGEYLEKKKPM